MLSSEHLIQLEPERRFKDIAADAHQTDLVTRDAHVRIARLLLQKRSLAKRLPRTQRCEQARLSGSSPFPAPRTRGCPSESMLAASTPPVVGRRYMEYIRRAPCEDEEGITDLALAHYRGPLLENHLSAPIGDQLDLRRRERRKERDRGEPLEELCLVEAVLIGHERLERGTERCLELLASDEDRVQLGALGPDWR